MISPRILDFFENPASLKITKITKDNQPLFVFSSPGLTPLFLFEEQAKVIFNLTEMHNHLCDNEECDYHTLNRKLSPFFAPTRWKAEVGWKLNNGSERNEVFDIEEVDELQDIVEAGPSWTEVKSITIHLEYRA